MISLSTAFLVCKLYTGMSGELHPLTYELLAGLENGAPFKRSLITMVLIDSRNLPLVECLFEQFSVERIYPSKSYPKPPFDVDGAFMRGMLQEWTK